MESKPEVNILKSRDDRDPVRFENAPDGKLKLLQG
jgi:hypothetical protein